MTARTIVSTLFALVLLSVASVGLDHSLDRVIAIDRPRITRHLAEVEAILRSADTRDLTDAQKAARARSLDYLRLYWRRGVYPHNHGRPESRTPVFIDEHGTHCAVGFMIAMSGAEALARRIAATANQATIAELSDDPELRQWLESNGLSALDAALIQPTYGPVPREDQDYDRATAVATLIDVPLAIVNIVGPERRNPWAAFGLIAGASQTGLGIHGLIRHEDRVNGPDYIRNSTIAINIGLGVASAGLGLYRLLSDGPAAGNDDGVEGMPGAIRWTLAPWVSADGGAGLTAALRF
jgi:hypothetical protein